MSDFTKQIVADADDKNYVDGSEQFYYLYFNNTNNSVCLCGLRFTNITIPQGANISSAKLQIYVSTTDADDPAFRIYAHDVDNSGAIADYTDLNGRAKTTAYVDWEEDSVGASQFIDSPEIKSVIQEIVNRAGWASGNALTLITNDLSKGKYFSAIDYGYLSVGPTYAAKLVITYNEPTITDSNLPSVSTF